MMVPVVLLESDVALAVSAEVCLGCGGRKRVGAPICDSCLALLPLYLRHWVTKRVDGRYSEGLRRALQHIVDVRPLWRHWPYQSIEELEAAGFRFADYGQCRSVRCLQQVVWVRTPNGGMLPVDAVTYRPHAEVCFDPVGVVLGRIRRLQTPAGRRRKAKVSS